MKNTVKHLWLSGAAVEAAAEFRQVAGQMFWVYSMMNATNIAFHISDLGMHLGKHLHGLGPNAETTHSCRRGALSKTL